MQILGCRTQEITICQSNTFLHKCVEWNKLVLSRKVSQNINTGIAPNFFAYWVGYHSYVNACKARWLKIQNWLCCTQNCSCAKNSRLKMSQILIALNRFTFLFNWFHTQNFRTYCLINITCKCTQSTATKNAKINTPDSKLLLSQNPLYKVSQIRLVEKRFTVFCGLFHTKYFCTISDIRYIYECIQITVTELRILFACGPHEHEPVQRWNGQGKFGDFRQFLNKNCFKF